MSKDLSWGPSSQPLLAKLLAVLSVCNLVALFLCGEVGPPGFQPSIRIASEFSVRSNDGGDRTEKRPAGRSCLGKCFLDTSVQVLGVLEVGEGNLFNEAPEVGNTILFAGLLDDWA